MKKNNKLKGNYGESLVYNYLEKNDYQVLCKNFTCKFGEIDIIFLDKKDLVFGEIKSRTSTIFGNPSEAVNYYKIKHIINTSKFYLKLNEINGLSVRYDVIEVYLNNNKHIINHIKNAFDSNIT